MGESGLRCHILDLVMSKRKIVFETELIRASLEECNTSLMLLKLKLPLCARIHPLYESMFEIKYLHIQGVPKNKTPHMTGPPIQRNSCVTLKLGRLHRLH